MKIDLDLIIAESKKFGLDLVSHRDAGFLYNEYEKLKSWQNSGFAAGMKYMQRSPDLLCDPLKLLEGAKSLLVFGLYYDRSPAPQSQKGFGRVARYAWGKDYHKVIKMQLKQLMASLTKTLGGEISFRFFSDAVPLLERAVAREAGLGFSGKNSMLIRPKSGSYFFIAEVLSDIEISGGKLAVLEENCGTCVNCKTNCPTEAIVSDYVVDANRCISYLTIEKKGILNQWEREALGEWIFGCDVCQEVCPFNHQSLKKGEAPALQEFSANEGVGGLLNLSSVLGIRTDDEYQKLFCHTALTRAGRESLLRNAAFVAANTLSESVTESIKHAFLNDSSEIVRAASFSSLSRINHKCNILSKNEFDSLANKAFLDTPMVKEELNYANAA